MGVLYSSVSGLLAYISRAYRFLSPVPRNIQPWQNAVIVVLGLNSVVCVHTYCICRMSVHANFMTS